MLLETVKEKILCETLPKFMSKFPACSQLNDLEIITKTMFNEISAVVMPELILSFNQVAP